MAITSVQDREIVDALAPRAKSPADTVYVVDFQRALYSEQVHDIVMGFLGRARSTEARGHPRPQNMQLATPNHRGAHRPAPDRLDATIAGLGRGAGNCPMELLLRVPQESQVSTCARFIECIEKHFLPLRQKMDGLQHPYMIHRMLNEHPARPLPCARASSRTVLGLLRPDGRKKA